MFRLSANLAVYLHRDAIDFRKSINGLAAIVEHELGRDPFASAVYVFGTEGSGLKDRLPGRQPLPSDSHRCLWGEQRSVRPKPLYSSKA